MPGNVDTFARRLQVQKRMTRQTADFLVEALHRCASIRGVKKSHARMATSAISGVFKGNANTRAAFMDHMRRGQWEET